MLSTSSSSPSPHQLGTRQDRRSDPGDIEPINGKMWTKGPVTSEHVDVSDVNRFSAVARTVATGVALAGTAVFTVWILDLLPAALADGATMKVNGAIGFVLSGLSLWLVATRRRAASVLFAWAAMLLGLTTLSQDVFGWDLGLDQILIRRDLANASRSHRMAPAMSSAFVVFGAAVVAAMSRLPQWIANTLAGAVALIGMIACIGYLYDVQLVLGVARLTSMPIHAAFLLLSLAVGFFFTNPVEGAPRLFLSDTLAGATLRRLMPAALLAPLAFGWVQLVALRAGLFETEHGLSLVVVSMALTFALAIGWNAARLHRLETGRREAQEALLSRQARTRAILNNALDAIISIDGDGLITYWNRRAETMFGWSTSEALGRNLADLAMPERYREPHRRGLQRYLETREPTILGREIEIAGLRRDGAEFPIRLSVVALPHEDTVSFSAFVSDITMRKRAEDALVISERHKGSLLRLSKALEQAHTYSNVIQAALVELRAFTGYQHVWAYLLSPDGAQASLITLVGGVATERVEQGFQVLTVKGDRMMEEIFAGKGPVVVEDARTDPRTNKGIVAELGNRTIINVAMSLADRQIGALGTGTFGDEGVRLPSEIQLEYISAMASHVAVALDRVQLLDDRERAMSEVRVLNAKLEQRVIERTAQLEASNKELEAFSYSISHDLRAPLRHISGYSSILLEEHSRALSADGQRYLSVIRNSAQNMGRMIDALLEMARLDRRDVQVRPTDFNVLVQEVRRDLQGDVAGRSIDWQVGELPVVECDPGLIKLVFANLLSNAVKYTRKRERAVIQISHRVVDGTPAIVVSDNGAGFDQRYAGKLFGVFQRLHNPEEFEGTGIGLATVHRIVTRHRGRIWVEAEDGKGATFFFTLGEMGSDTR